MAHVLTITDENGEEKQVDPIAETLRQLKEEREGGGDWRNVW